MEIKSDQKLFERVKYTSNSNIKDHVIINLRGHKFELLSSRLDKYPNTRLSKLKQAIDQKANDFDNICDAVYSNRNEFYFDRDPVIFNMILNFYSTDKLHIVENICLNLILDELAYWEIDDNYIEKCCEWKCINGKNLIDGELANCQEVLKILSKNEKFDNFVFPSFREKLWNILERPKSSIPANVSLIIYIFSVLL